MIMEKAQDLVQSGSILSEIDPQRELYGINGNIDNQSTGLTIELSNIELNQDTAAGTGISEILPRDVVASENSDKDPPPGQDITGMAPGRAIAFIDSAVPEYQSLMAGIKPGTEVIVLDSTTDGVAQITDALADRANISSVHILGHGNAGSMQLGNSILDSNTLGEWAPRLQQWSASLSSGADILLYGCDVALGAEGLAFVNQLSQLTGADIAASNDLTGSSEQDGDWVLEVSTGNIEASLAFQQGALAAYESVFALIDNTTAQWTANTPLGNNNHYLNNNFSAAGNPLTGAIDGGPVEYQASDGVVVNNYNNFADGAKSALELGSYIFFAGDDGQGIRRIDNDWSNNLTGYQATAEKTESITTDGTFIYGNDDVNRDRIIKWSVNNSFSSFTLNEQWAQDVGTGGRFRGISYFDHSAATGDEYIYASDGGADGGFADRIWAFNADNGAPTAVNFGGTDITVPGTSLGTTSLDRVYQAIVHEVGGRTVLMAVTLNSLHVWDMASPTTTISATPTESYSLNAGSGQLFANGGSGLSGNFFGAGARGSQLFLLHGSQVSAYQLSATPLSTEVTNINDSGSGSLRQALIHATANPGADTITFTGSTFTDATPDIITLVSGELSYTGGAGNDLTIQAPGNSRLTINGGGSSRVFNINSAANVTIDGLTITGGNNNEGGGIKNMGTGTFTLLNSTIVNNTASNLGGGIFNDSSSTAILTNSTFSGNSSGGGIYNSGTLTINNSTITGNNAASFGGGINNAGTGTANVNNTIVVGNTAGIFSPEVLGTFTSNGSNVIGNLDGNTSFGSDTTGVAVGDVINTTLADNGGTTQTHALVPGGDAVDGGNNTDVPGGITTDQRGTGFARVSNGTVDIGAYELQASDIAISSPAIAAASVLQGTTNHPLYQLDLAVTTDNAQLTGATFTTGGTYISADIVPSSFELFYSTDTTFDAGDASLGTKAVVTSGSNLAFTGLSQTINSGTTGTLFLVADIAAGATAGNTINIAAPTLSDITFAAGDKTGTPTAGGAQTFDAIPTITSINSSTSNGTFGVGGSVNVTVNFSENVTLAGGNLTVNLDTGGTVSISPFANSNTASGTYNVVAGQNSTDLNSNSPLVLAGGATLQDATGNNVTLTIPGGQSLADNKDIVIDTTAPTVTVEQAVGQVDPTNSSPINYTVTFSEPVTGFATGDVTLGGSASATTATVTGSGTTYNVAVSGMTGGGTVIASLGAGVAMDAAGNANVASTSTDNNVTFNGAPVLDLNGGASGIDYSATFISGGGEVAIVDSANLTVTDDGANLTNATVTITNLLDGANEVLTPDTSGTSISFNYNSGTGVLTLSGSDTVANYQQVLRTVKYNNTAASPNTTPRAIEFIVNDGSLNSTTATTTLNITLVPEIAIASPAIAAASVLQGTTNHPLYQLDLAVTTDNAQLTGATFTTGGTYISADIVPNSFELFYSTDTTFDAGVDASLGTKAVVTSGNNLAFTGLSQAINSGTTGTLFLVADIAPGATAGNTINIAAPTVSDITFAAGNKTGTPTAGGAQTFDAIPTITSINSSTSNGTFGVGGNVDVTVNFSENVTLTGGDLTVNLDTGGVVSISPFANSNMASGTYTVIAGENSADLNSNSPLVLAGGATLQDGTGNNVTLTIPGGQSLADNKDIVIETTVPTFTSITRQTPATEVTNADTLVFRATFSEDVQNVDATDFTVTGTTAITSISGSGNVYDITVSGGDLAELNGTVGLNLAAGQNIADLAGNNLPATEPATDETYTLDNTAPSASTPDMTAATDSGSSNSDNITSDTTPTFTGTAEANSTVTLTSSVNGNIGTATADGSGNWSITASTLNEGAHDITAMAADAVGNMSPASSALTITIDTGVPAAPSVPDMTDATDTGSSSSDNITNDATPTFTGTAAANSTVTLSSSVNGNIGTATADGSGNWTITASTLNEGAHNITATATDAAGNVSSASSALAITIDTGVPAAPSAPDMTDISDTGSSNSDNITSNVTPAFTGTAAANSTVTLASSVNGNIGTTTANGAGNWTITASTLNEGAHNITATATDAGGNTSPASSILAITIDTGVPAAPSAPDMTDASDTGSSNSDNITSNATPTFTGTAEANSTVTLSSSVNGNIGTATADGSGNWTITASTLNEGAHDITATTTDAAGNVSSASSILAITIDTGVPGAPSMPNMTDASDTGSSNSDNITSNTTPTFTGTTEANTTVTLSSSVNGNIGTTTADGSGNWTITASSLNEGAHNITATATDGGGNTSPASSALAITIDTTAPTVTINQGGSQADPTAAGPIDFVVLFNEPVTDFITGDVTTSGTASGTLTGTVSETAPNDGTTYNVAVSGMTGNGTVIASLGAGVAMDLAGNTNAASTSTDNTVTFAANSAPVLDLNGGASGIDHSATFIRGGGEVAIVDSANLTVTDDGANLTSATVTITNLQDGANEVLTVDTSGTSIISNYNSGTGVLTLSGSHTVANYQQVLRTVKYNNTAVSPNTTARAIAFLVNDGSVNSTTATTTLDITSATPIDVGTVSGPTFAPIGSISDSNPDNIYNVTMGGGTSRLIVELVTPFGNTDLQLYDSSGNLVDSSTNSGTASERIDRSSLTAGNYQVRVFQASPGVAVDYLVRMLAF